MRRRETERKTMQNFVTLQRRIMRRLEDAGPTGINRARLYRSLGSPTTKSSLDIALEALRRRGKALVRRIETGLPGRPSEVWWAAGLVPEELA